MQKNGSIVDLLHWNPSTYGLNLERITDKMLYEGEAVIPHNNN
jgi:hypothetical protein